MVSPGQLFDAVHQLAWRDVPGRAVAIAQRCEKVAKAVQAAVREIPGVIAVSYQPNDYSRESEGLIIDVVKSAEGENIRQRLYDATGCSPLLRCWDDISQYQHSWDQPGIKVAMTPLSVLAAREKRAYTPNFRKLLSYLGWNEDAMKFPGWPSPAAAMLATGMLGAGAGYGIGALGEQMLPEDWQRHRLRRTLALVGGLGGAAVAAPWMTASKANDKSIFSSWPMEGPPVQNKAAQYDLFGEDHDLNIRGNLNVNVRGRANIAPMIDVSEFNQTLWSDPYVAPYVSPQTRAAATGLVLGASHLAGGGSPTRLISPFDVAKMTAGMGTGYLSGVLVGKALGALTGLPTSAQDRLKQTGMWAGALANIVPLAFGG